MYFGRDSMPGLRKNFHWHQDEMTVVSVYTHQNNRHVIAKRKPPAVPVVFVL
jgi:hypothetical protein